MDQSTALYPLPVRGCPASCSKMDPFGKGSLSGPKHGCKPSCNASKDHCTQCMMGLQVSETVADFGQAQIRQCEVKLLCALRDPPQFQTIKESLLWNSTPSAWMNIGMVVSGSCTCLLARPCLSSRQMGWPWSRSSWEASTPFQNSFRCSTPNKVSN